MPFDPNDYPLGKEYQTRIMRQAQQDLLAREVRAGSLRRAIPGRKRLTFAVVAITLTVMLFIGLQYGLV
jgi:hypothetical protein